MGKAPLPFLIDYTGITVPASPTSAGRSAARIRVPRRQEHARPSRASRGRPSRRSQALHRNDGRRYSQTDAVALAKVIHTFGKTNPHVKVKAAPRRKGSPGLFARGARTIAVAPRAHRQAARVMLSPVAARHCFGPPRNVAATIAAVAKAKRTDA